MRISPAEDAAAPPAGRRHAEQRPRAEKPEAVPTKAKAGSSAEQEDVSMETDDAPAAPAQPSAKAVKKQQRDADRARANRAPSLFPSPRPPSWLVALAPRVQIFSRNEVRFYYFYTGKSALVPITSWKKPLFLAKKDLKPIRTRDVCALLLQGQW